MHTKEYCKNNECWTIFGQTFRVANDTITGIFYGLYIWIHNYHLYDWKDISSLAFDGWIITVVLNSRTQVRYALLLYLRHYYLEHCIIPNEYFVFEIRPASWVYRSVFFHNFSLWYYVLMWWLWLETQQFRL